MNTDTIGFGRFRVDPRNHSLWKGERELRVTPKAFAVLQYLLDHAGQVTTKDELLRNVWPGTIVTEAALTVCIRELRRKLGDDAKTPQYIETVHTRGYRFIAKVVSSQHSVVSSEEEENQKAKIEDFSPTPSTHPPAPPLVGRDAELAQLHTWLDKALHGDRQLVFVAGEPGWNWDGHTG